MSRFQLSLMVGALAFVAGAVASDKSWERVAELRLQSAQKWAEAYNSHEEAIRLQAETIKVQREIIEVQGERISLLKVHK